MSGAGEACDEAVANGGGAAPEAAENGKKKLSDVENGAEEADESRDDDGGGDSGDESDSSTPSSGATATAAAKDGKPEVRLPQKRYFRQRAHVNPLSDRPLFHPENPSSMDWSEFYPAFFGPEASEERKKKKVEILDVGCGYGGLLIELAKLYPEKLALGFEIREKVSRYVRCRIDALRVQEPGLYQNAACIRTNAMKYMLNFFGEGQLTHLFFLFPDPHFKKKKHKWRIINADLMHEYAYTMAEGGLAYTLTDVEQLHDWMKKHFNDHPLFEPVSEAELEKDPVLKVIWDSSEEGKKVSRNEGSKHLAVFRRVSAPGITADTLVKQRPPPAKRRRKGPDPDVGAGEEKEEEEDPCRKSGDVETEAGAEEEKKTA